MEQEHVRIRIDDKELLGSDAMVHNTGDVFSTNKGKKTSFQAYP
jgi:hypothetical protein